MSISRFITAILLAEMLPLFAYSQDKNTVYKDEVYTDVIKSVQLFPETGANGQQLQAPVIPLSQPVPLLLRFDLLKDNYDFLRAKLVHCDFQWKKSNLSDIEYLQEFNQFDLFDYAYSGTTKQLYVNYEFKIPKVKLSGNYAVVVFQTDNPDEVLFVKRFIVFENVAFVQSLVRVSTSPGLRMSHQQIDFNVSHPTIRPGNPRSEFKVVVRQNQRWDNVINDLVPTRIDMANNSLEYRPFQGENTFLAGNEFRFFDIRTLTFRGQFVEKVDRNLSPSEAWVTIDKSRQGRVYAELRDLNGGYFVDTNELGGDYLDADYVYVNFRLKIEPSLEPIYVIGAFNLWKKDEKSKMQLDPETGIYHQRILLKQGIYDYQYWVDGSEPLRHDGSFFQANNQYEIFVYYKSFNDRTDRVVGYQSFNAEL